MYGCLRDGRYPAGGVKLLGQLDRLIGRTRVFSRLGKSTDKIKQDFQRIAKQLHAHEAAEHRILEQGFGIEVE